MRRTIIISNITKIITIITIIITVLMITIITTIMKDTILITIAITNDTIYIPVNITSILMILTTTILRGWQLIFWRNRDDGCQKDDDAKNMTQAKLGCWMMLSTMISKILMMTTKARWWPQTGRQRHPLAPKSHHLALVIIIISCQHHCFSFVIFIFIWQLISSSSSARLQYTGVQNRN